MPNMIIMIVIFSWRGLVCCTCSVEALSHCPYLLHHKLLFWLLFCMPCLFELPTALLEYLDFLWGGGALEYLDFFTGGCSPPGCYTYMIMIIKMIEIYNIAAQSYYCWWTMHTASKQSHCTLHLCIYHLKKFC